MKKVKFGIKEEVYEQFKAICQEEEITVKKKLDDLMKSEVELTPDITIYFPENHGDHLRTLTLKICDDMFHNLRNNAEHMDIKVKKYVSYLIYKCVKEQA